MTPEYSSFQIQQLRMMNAVKAIEGILVIIASFLVAAFLPQLLVQFVYSNQQLTEQPMLLVYMPAVIFAIGLGYFLFAMIGNLRREMKAQSLEKELATFAEAEMEDCMCGDCEDCGADCEDCDSEACCGGNCCHHDELGEMTEMEPETEEKEVSPIAKALKASKRK